MLFQTFLETCNCYMGSVIRIILLLCVGVPLLRYISTFFISFCTQRFSRHIGLLVGHCIFYGGIVFICVNILHEFGFNVTALLGAAGVIGVAIGFASQTSISNIISGFFLLLERPFFVGDTIKSDDVVGVVESIDLLAVRVRTADNKLIRIPNEMVLKKSLTNVTFYSIKRVDFMLSVLYNEDINMLKTIVSDIVIDNSIFLKAPEPTIKINKIVQPDFTTETRIFVMVNLWVNKDAFFAAGTLFIEALKKECDKKNIIITAGQIN